MTSPVSLVLQWTCTHFSDSAVFLPRKHFQILCPVSVFKHQTCPLDSIPVHRCQDIIFRLFYYYFDLFLVPHTVVLSPWVPAPMAMVQHFSPHSSIKCSISPAKPVLEKACSPCSSYQYLFPMKLHENACEFLINVSPLPNVTLSCEGERKDRGIRDKQKNKK